MRRRLTLIGSWAIGTMLAILLASLAVHLAGAKVTERPGATISRTQIEQDLASRSAAVPTTEASTTSTSTTVAASGDPLVGQGGGNVSASSTTTTRVITPSTTPAAPAPTTIPTATPPTVDDRRSPSPGSPGGPVAPTPTTAVASSEQTFVLVGGSVRVRCDGAVVRLVSSAPAAGFVMEVHNPGPGQTVEVRFESDDHRSELKATCAAGVITAEPREQAG